MNKIDDKRELISWIASIDDEILLEELKVFKDSHSGDQSDWWFHLSEEDKDSINKGLEDVQNSRLVSHSEVMQRYEKFVKDRLD